MSQSLNQADSMFPSESEQEKESESEGNMEYEGEDVRDHETKVLKKYLKPKKARYKVMDTLSVIKRLKKAKKMILIKWLKKAGKEDKLNQEMQGQAVGLTQPGTPHHRET